MDVSRGENNESGGGEIETFFERARNKTKRARKFPRDAATKNLLQKIYTSYSRCRVQSDETRLFIRLESYVPTR